MCARGLLQHCVCWRPSTAVLTLTKTHYFCLCCFTCVHRWFMSFCIGSSSGVLLANNCTDWPQSDYKIQVVCSGCRSWEVYWSLRVCSSWYWCNVVEAALVVCLLQWCHTYSSPPMIKPTWLKNHAGQAGWSQGGGCFYTGLHSLTSCSLLLPFLHGVGKRKLWFTSVPDGITIAAFSVVKR